MSLHKQTLVIIGATLLGLIALLYVASQLIFLSSFTHLEETLVHQNVQRVLSVLSDEITNLSTAANDYARWDDTYRFVQDRNEDYIASNLAETTLTNLGLNMMLFFNTSGEMVYGIAVDLDSEEEVPLPSGLQDYLTVDSPQIQHTDLNSDVSGLLLLPDHPLLIASRPILTSQGEGPIKGALIFGRFLTTTEIQSLAETTHLAVSIHPVADPLLPAGFQSTSTSPSDVFIQPVNSQTIAGYSTLYDVSGNPALAVQVEIPRDIYQQGQTTIGYFVVSLVVVGLVFGVVIVLALERAILSRLRRLNEDVGKISVSGTLSDRVRVRGRDELSNLANAINTMLTALERSQERLRAVVHSAPIMLWVVDRDGRFTLLEGRSSRTLGIKPDQIGRSIFEVCCDIPQIITDTRRVLAGDEVASIVTTDTLTSDVRFTPLRNSDGEVTGAIGVATDITERTLAEEALGQAEQSLEQQNRQLRRIHEFLRATLDQMRDAVEHDASEKELLSYIQQAQTEFDRMR